MMKMNKLMVPAAVAAVALSACAHTKTAPDNVPQIGTANPAAANTVYAICPTAAK